ncbi:Beta-TrCP [Dactylellina cionopaga]|nr:Beta-TrCP [Dactylellina cionopaga]
MRGASSVAFSPDGKQLAAGLKNDTVKIWDPISGVLIHTLEGHDWPVTSIAFSPDGKFLVSGSNDYTVMLWDTASGELLHTFSDHEEAVTSVAFSIDGILVSASKDNTIKIWDTASRELLRTIDGYRDVVKSVALSPDGKQLASGSKGNVVRIWDAVALRMVSSVHTPLTGRSNAVGLIRFSPNGQYLVSASDDGTIGVWDVASRTLIRTLEGHTKEIIDFVFSVDGKRLGSCSDHSDCRLWEIGGSWALVKTFNYKIDDPGMMVFSPDSRHLAITPSSFGKKIMLLDATTGSLIKELKGFDGSGYSIALTFSPDGKLLASGSADEKIIIWETLTGAETPVQTFESGLKEGRSLSFSPDGQQLVWALENTNGFRLLDRASGAIRISEGHTALVKILTFSPDGKLLTSYSSDDTIRLWDVASFAEIGSLSFSNISRLSFSKDGQSLETNLGNIDLQVLGVTLEKPRISGSFIAYKNSWVNYNGLDVLWISPEYRNLTTYGNTLAFASVDEGIAFLEVSDPLLK